jgi:uncharacterized membrane protein YeaQ/YmgE (transglycosylase-associated protein family)
MKKISIVIAVVLAAAGLSYGASITTNSNGQIIENYTNAFGQVMNIVIGQAGSSTATTVVPAPGTILTGTAAPTATPTQVGQVALDLGDAAYIAVGTTSSDWLSIPSIMTDTNTTVDQTDTRPASVGAILIGTVSNKVWLAEGITTNDWIELK